MGPEFFETRIRPVLVEQCCKCHSAKSERLRGDPLRRSDAADELLSRAVERLPLSGRGRARVSRVAATAAALAGAPAVEAEHVAEALSYRTPREVAAAA